MTSYVPLISAVSVAIIGTLLAPWVLSLIKGKADLEATEREQWRTERRERDQERTREIQGLKLENRTLRESHDDLEARFAEVQRIVTGQQEQIAALEQRVQAQNGHLRERDQEIAQLKARIAELERENLRLYREIEDLRQGQR
jgi:predicted RNase H-like nuclease (RuvC/YqgF family)